ncbi:hypothetical protein BDK51DRAFT_49426 [Blyttiomyces helicus]|uniref:Replication protein A C-terminal domain-containing protein n=1 Tax=Blyttiomyces helicus TaxID=388810 RepID=A0A4P9WRU8_9FUNG|nr:hypothetical protein BDK51DRAFT_49426 [Blyttiomyces helicus]|eukprot:RKO93666.1 hypothetical protein BDK51DRAFT_49426 [Blyttiomyces helicus]
MLFSKVDSSGCRGKASDRASGDDLIRYGKRTTARILGKREACSGKVHCPDGPDIDGGPSAPETQSTTPSRPQTSYENSDYAPPSHQQYPQQDNRAADGFTNLQRMIVDFARKFSNTIEGASIAETVHALRAHASEKDIRDAITSLQEEGNLYTSSDEEHFKNSD